MVVYERNMVGGNKKNAATQHEQRHPKPMYN